MRQFIVLPLVAGCAAKARAENQTVTVSDAGIPVLELSVPAGAKIYPPPPKTTIVTPGMFLSIWPVAGVQTADAALPHVAEAIRGDVLQFQVSQTNALVVAGAPAFHLIGTGVEADDGDPSTADAVVFAAGTHVFVACVHGEHNDASRERQPMLDALNTVQIP